jgi:signal peptidase II
MDGKRAERVVETPNAAADLLSPTSAGGVGNQPTYESGGMASRRRRLVVFVTIATCGFAADWLTKYWIFQLPPGPGRQGEWWWIEDFCGVQHAWNHGALWGMGQGYSSVFAGISVLAGLGIVVWLVRGGALSEWRLVVALSGVLGGIGGNLYDRLGWWGDVNASGELIYAVRDWILFRFRGWTWPNFNIADCLLVGGSVLLAWHALVTPPSEVGESAEVISSKVGDA